MIDSHTCLHAFLRDISKEASIVERVTKNVSASTDKAFAQRAIDDARKAAAPK